jgi:hypothetical protein
MRVHAKIVLGLTCLLAGPALGHPATLIPVTPVPGSAATNVFAINASNEIVGTYTTTDGIEHGFHGPLNGSYITFDYAGTALGTELRGLNDSGDMVGLAPDASGISGPEFFLSHDGALKTYTLNHAALLGINQGINKRGLTVGDYISDPETNTQTGYEGRKGHYLMDLSLGFSAHRVDARAITSTGIVAGWYTDSDALQHGFILNGGAVQTIDADDSGTTDLEGLNDKGIATGAVLDEDENFHAFVLDTNTSTFTWIDVPGATSVQIWGINKSGLAALATDIGSFIYCPLKPAACPSGGTLVEMRESKLVPVTHPMKARVVHGALKGLAR